MAANTARLEARISQDLSDMIKRAASIQGRSVSDLVVQAVYEAAASIIERAEVLTLSRADQELFAKALLAPKPTKTGLDKAFTSKKRLLVSDV